MSVYLYAYLRSFRYSENRKKSKFLENLLFYVCCLAIMKYNYTALPACFNVVLNKWRNKKHSYILCANK